MIKTLLSLVFALVISSPTVQAQQIDFFGGVNRNDLYDGGDDLHYRSVLVNKWGYTVGVGIDSLFKIPMEIILQYDWYGVEVTASNGGLGSGYTVEASVRKSIISLVVIPIRIRPSPKLGIGLGFGYSHLINENYKGIRSDWSLIMPLDTTDLNEAYTEFSEKWNFGFLARTVYSIPLSGSISLTPHFSWYVGLQNEFKWFPTTIKSMRFYLGIGIKKDFNRR